MFEYIHYLWNAKKRHGIHSPFIYEMSDKCLGIQIDALWKKDFQQLKSDLRGNRSTIKILDHGAGSKRMGTERMISTIYKNSATKGKYAYLLYRLTHHYQFQHMLEMGTSLGVGTLHLHRGNPTGKLTTVEACPQTYAAAQENFEKYSSKNITSHLGTFVEFLTNYSGEPFDFVYVDGHHDGKALHQYMALLQPHTHSSTIFLIDDIRWSKDMYASWNKLKDNPTYHVSIDFFRMGILIQRPEQEKEHFVLRLTST